MLHGWPFSDYGSLDFDSLPATNPINTIVDTQLGCDFLDPQLVRVIKIKYACVVCNKRVTNAQKSICCNVCDEWTHTQSVLACLMKSLRFTVQLINHSIV